MYYLLFYEKAPGYAERQKPFADAHREYLEKFATEGSLLAGSLEQPNDGSALLLFKADSDAAINPVAENDPYVQNGIVTKWWVRPWDLVLGTSLKNL